MKDRLKYSLLTGMMCSILLFIAGCLYAQYYFTMFRPQADTIYAKLHHASERDKIEIYNSLAFYHSFSNADSAILYAERALELEKKHPDEIRRADAYRQQGNAYALKNLYGQAFFYLNSALQIYEENEAYRKTAEVWFDLGKLNHDLDDFNKAHQCSMNFEKIYDENHRQDRIIATPIEYGIFLGLTGATLRNHGDYQLAKQYMHRYLDLSRNHDFPFQIDAIMILILAQTLQLNHEYDSALYYCYLGRDLFPEKAKIPATEYTNYNATIGSLLFKTDRPSEALSVLKPVFNDYLNHEYFHHASANAASIGNIYQHFGNQDSSLHYYLKVLSVIDLMREKELGHSLDATKPYVYGGYQNILLLPDTEIRQHYYKQMVNGYDNLYNYYLQINDTSKAFIYLQKKLPYTDSLKMTSKQIELYRIEARFENERLEQQVNNLARDNELAAFKLQRNQLVLASVGVIFLLVVALGVFYFRQSRINAMHEKLLVQQRLFRSQMNPHFIFNSLSIVQNFIVKHDDAKASIYLSRFSELVRSILNNSSQEQITLEEELATIGNYLALQKVRFSDQFDYELEVDDSLDPESTFVPPMLTQPFIENAIEHGIRNLGSKGKIDVRFIRRDDKILLEIEDNGIGREKAQELLRQRDKTHKSLATAITMERITVLNRKLKRKITMEIMDLKDEQGEARGTRVVFGLPV
jgi:tetratricopeptide (TPR) repeat protein